MFSTTTSAVLTRASNIARPRGAFRFSVTPFLLEFSSRKNHASSPRLSESAVRPGSPPGASILMTSAPSHASIWVQEGPASYWVRSRTRMPSRALDMVSSPVGRECNRFVVDRITAAGRRRESRRPARRVGVAVGVRIAPHQGDVGLGLRGIVEGEGQLRVDLPGGAKGSAESVQHLADGRGVPAALRLTNDERTVEQLEQLAGLEHAQVDQTFVLDACPAAGAWSGLYRRGHLIELRAVKDGGDQTPLHRIDPEPEPFQRVGAQDFEVAWLTEQAEGV